MLQCGLSSKCTISRLSNGYRFTATNGNSIFIPYAGTLTSSGASGIWSPGMAGEYLCSTRQYGYFFYEDGGHSLDGSYQYLSGNLENNRFPIRPVYVESATPVPTIQDAFTIPSGVTLSINNSTSYPWENNAGTLTPGNSGVHSSDSYFTATTTCANNATLTFDWYVSSESGCDYLYYCVDGGTKTQISGSTSVASQSIYLCAGTHTITFGYKKDGSVNTGSDMGYISNLKIQKEAVLPPGVVDLGLPSGTKWANRNVGAAREEDYGNHYAWGETTTKSTYSWSTYKYCNGSSSTLTKYCTNGSYGTVDNKTELEESDDAAYVNMGPQWRMPSYEQMMELWNSCTVTWTTQNGVNGRRFTGPNGNSIFLPAAGSENGNAGVTGIYASRTLASRSNNECECFWFENNYGPGAPDLRYLAWSIRPVYVGSTNYLTITDTICSQGTTVNLPVNLTNSSAISEIGFIVELPEGITVKKNASNRYYVNFTDRGENHSCTARDVADGVKMAIVNMEGDAFIGNEGTIFTLPLQISSTMPNGNYTIRLKEVELSDGNLYELEDITAAITVTANRITVQNIEGYAGTTVQFPVNLINRDAITEVGFVVSLPEGITLDKNASNQYYVNLTDRAEDHSATGLDVADGVKFAVLSMSGDAFTGTSGAIFTLPLQISSSLAEGLYPVRLSEIQLSDGRLYEIGDVEAYVNVHRYTKGDVNNDGRIAVNDISLTIQAYLGNPSADFIEYAGDMNDNGRIDVADISGVVSAYLNASAVSRSAAKRAASANVDSDNLTLKKITASAGDILNLEIGLNNDIPYTEVGGYISLPEGFSFVTKTNGKYDITLNRDRLPDHTVTTKMQDNGELKFALVNIVGDPVVGTEGTIMSVKVKVDGNVASGNYEVMLHDIQLSDGSLHEPRNVSSVVAIGSEATGIVNVGTDADDGSIYSIDGVKLNSITKDGIYVVGGKKVVVKKRAK